MTLSKSQIVKNLIKYGVIPASAEKRCMLSKRENLVKLMSESLTAQSIKEIYESEYTKTEDEKDYTLLDRESIMKARLTQCDDNVIINLELHKKVDKGNTRPFKEAISNKKAKAISKEKVNDLIKIINEFYG